MDGWMDGCMICRCVYVYQTSMYMDIYIYNIHTPEKLQVTEVIHHSALARERCEQQAHLCHGQRGQGEEPQPQPRARAQPQPRLRSPCAPRGLARRRWAPRSARQRALGLFLTRRSGRDSPSRGGGGGGGPRAELGVDYCVRGLAWVTGASRCPRAPRRAHPAAQTRARCVPTSPSSAR